MNVLFLMGDHHRADAMSWAGTPHLQTPNLDRPGLRENTIVIWTSDHGDQLDEHGLLTKLVTREASVHVPLMISVPGQSSLDVNALTEHVDLFPTGCELVGVDVPDTIQGRSLVPWLEGQCPDNWRAAVFSETHEQGAAHISMIRTMDWKLNTYDGEPGELYHLVDDPNELRNLCGDPHCQNSQHDLERELRGWRGEQRVQAMVLSPVANSPYEMERSKQEDHERTTHDISCPVPASH